VTTLSATTVAALDQAGLDADAVERLLRAELAEDIGAGDLTSNATVPDEATLDCAYVSRADGVAAGLPVLAAVADLALPDGRLTTLVADGDVLHPGTVLARVEGSARQILALERTSLNLLGHLCGIASQTRRWVDAVAGTGARIRDTRKTLPLLRDLQKYAVRCGGGVNHRHGLHDAVLIKDNHVAAAGGVGAALDAVHAAGLAPDVVVQVEVDSLDQLDQALAHGATQVLIDNFDLADAAEAVRRVRARAPRVLVEASGGLTLDRAAAVAATGVDFLAVGALTHSVVVLDIGLDAPA